MCLCVLVCRDVEGRWWDQNPISGRRVREHIHPDAHPSCMPYVNDFGMIAWVLNLMKEKLVKCPLTRSLAQLTRTYKTVPFQNVACLKSLNNWLVRETKLLSSLQRPIINHLSFPKENKSKWHEVCCHFKMGWRRISKSTLELTTVKDCEFSVRIQQECK